MKTYLATLTIMMPYPKTITYRVGASSLPVAVARAARMLRSDIPKKRLNELTLKIVKIQSENRERTI